MPRRKTPQYRQIRWNAVDLRAWVVERNSKHSKTPVPLDPEEIDAEVEKKLGPIDRASAGILSDLYSKGSALRRALKGGDPASHTGNAGAHADDARLRADLEAALVAGAYAAVGAYWQDRPYKGKLFPRIVVRGAPWRVPAGAIHVLDLPLGCIEEAVAKHPAFRAARTGSTQSASDGPLERLRSLAEQLQPLIRADPILAVGHEHVTDLLRGLTELAHYHEQPHAVRLDAANLLDDVLDAFRVRRLRQEDRPSDEDALALNAEYQEIFTRLDPIKRALRGLRRTPPTTTLLSQVRGLKLPIRVTAADLRAWHRRKLSRHAIAKELVARRHRMSPKTLQHKIDLAPTLAALEEAWTDYERATRNDSQVTSKKGISPRSQSDSR